MPREHRRTGSAESRPERSARQLPRYHVVYRAIADQIASGLLRPGDQLPGERALCEQFGVGRGTGRRALRALARDGLIECHERRGSFVTSGAPTGLPPRRAGELPSALVSFEAWAAASGLAVSTKVFAQKVRPAMLDEAAALEIPPGAELFELERLRFVEGRPVVHSWERLPLSRTRGVESADYTTASLYETLEAKAALKPASAEYTIEARSLSDGEARVLELELEPGAAVLRVKAITFDRTGVPMCLGYHAYRSDRYRFQAMLHGEGPSARDASPRWDGRLDPLPVRRSRTTVDDSPCTSLAAVDRS